MTEFEIISRYFSKPVTDDVLLAQGDDCALFDTPPGFTLAFSIDTLVEGRHFPLDYPARYVATRALGAALSDLAAMGAKASHFTLALTLPRFDEVWLDEFSSALYAMSSRFDAALVGGDTTSGPLALSIQAHGLVPQGMSLRRSGAARGDLLFVSGCLGDAAGGLKLLNNSGSYQSANGPLSDHEAYLRQRFNYPVPRLDVAPMLRNKASACIDISDGLLADAEHMAESSGLTAVIEVDAVPVSDALREIWPLDFESLALSGGDDYELLCAIPPDFQAWAESMGLVKIGELVSVKASPIKLLKDGLDYQYASPKGYLHFV